MKQLTAILLIFISHSGMAQNKASVSTVYYVDSVKTDAAYIKYMNQANVENVNLVKDAQDPDNAKVYFTLHDHSKFETLSRSPLLSLNDISKVHLTGTERSKPILYILDGKLLTDTVAVRIPSICVRNVTIVKAAETSYLKTVLPDALLLMISTQIPGIMIKGAAAAN